jgi:hypothetical protein
LAALGKACFPHLITDGVLYVLSFATVALVFATAIALVVSLLMNTLPQHLATASQAVSGVLFCHISELTVGL